MSTRRTLPTRPDVRYQLALVAFSHETMSSANNSFGKQRNLELIGRDAIRFAVSRLVYSRLDKLDHENDDDYDILNSDANLADWAREYKLDECRVMPNNIDPEQANSNIELAKVFAAYVGAVDVQFGADCVTQWITSIINAPELPPEPAAIPSSNSYPLSSFASSSSSSSVYSSSSPSMSSSSGVHNHQGHWGFAPAPPPPIFPASAPPSNRPSKSWSAVLNEGAQQKRRVLSFEAKSQGPSHQLTWTVYITMDNQPLAQGTGNSKQLAKEDASRTACQYLGWHQ